MPNPFLMLARDINSGHTIQWSAGEGVYQMQAYLHIGERITNTVMFDLENESSVTGKNVVCTNITEDAALQLVNRLIDVFDFVPTKDGKMTT